MNGHHKNCPECSACRDEAMRLKAELGIEPALPGDLVVSTEYEAVRNALLPFRYCDGRPVDPHERNLVGELLQLAAKYNSNGHWVASQLDKLFGQVQTMPRTAPPTTPEYPNWFLATIESRLQRQMRATAVNLPTAPSPEAKRILSSLMESTSLPSEECSYEERRAQELFTATGNKFDAVQACMSKIHGTDPIEGGLLIRTALWMIREGWANETPRKAPVLEFGKQEGRKQA